jgi:hypothetical protein
MRNEPASLALALQRIERVLASQGAQRNADGELL